MITDPRLNKPSASIFARLRACPGSWALSQGLPEVSSEDARRGSGIHDWIRAKLSRTADPAPVLPPDDEGTAETCLALVDRACAAAGYGARSAATQILCEERLWMNDRWSGQFDVLLQWGGRWLIVDFKTGRLETEEPADNQQLRALVALVSENYFPSEVAVAIIQPWISPQIPPLAKYDRPALELAVAESDGLVLGAMAPAAPRTPGDHCKYCPACLNAVCPEQRATMQAVTATPPVERMIEADMPKYLDACDQAEMAIEAIRRRAKQMLAENLEIPGWKLQPGQVRESITDIKTVYQRAAALGVTSDSFTAACSVTKKNLSGLLRAATGGKGAALEATMDGVLKGCVEEKTTAPSLKRA